MNLEIIINVFIALFIYQIFIKAFGAVLIKYFLDNSDSIQKEKKSFRDKLNEKLNNNQDK